MRDCPWRLWLLLLLLVVLSALATPAQAVTRYIKPDGNDSATGQDAGTAWLTFSTALSRLSCGDTLIVLDGVYTPSTTGMLVVDGVVCTAAAPLTIRALNPFKAWLQNNHASNSAAIYVLNNSQYIIVEGLRASDSNQTTAVYSNPASIWSGASHITFKKLLLHNNNIYQNNHLLDIDEDNCLDITLEDMELYNFHRHGIRVHDDSVSRRIFCNSRDWPAACNQSPQPFGCAQESDPSGGDACIAVYPGSNALLENIISENNNHVVEWDARHVLTGNRLLGSVSKDERDQAAWVDTRYSPGDIECPGEPLSWCFNKDTIHRHFVSVNNPRAVENLAGLRTRCDNCSVFGGSATVMGHIHHGYPSDLSTSQSSFFGDNNLIVVGSGKTAVDTDGGGTIQMRYLNKQGSGGVAGNVTVQNENTANPTLGSCLVYLPDGSPLKNAGINDTAEKAHIGAHLLYQYLNGSLTTTPLWNTTTGVWSGCGPVIAGINNTSTDSCATVHQRLQVNTAGCPFPSGYGGPPPTCPPDCPPDLTGILARWTFDEGSGTTYLDSSPEAQLNFPATVRGSAGWGPDHLGVTGKAYAGNITNGAGELTGSPIPSFSGAHSMCGWALIVNNAASSTGGSFQTLLNFAADANNGVRVLNHSGLTPTGLWHVTLRQSGALVEKRTTAAVLANNTWVHLCYTATATPTTLLLYVNGQSAAQVASTDGFSVGTGNMLGSRDLTNGNWGGRLDDWQVFGHVLTPQEVSDLYGGTSPAATRVRHRSLVR